MFGRKKDDAAAAVDETSPQANGSHVVRPGAKNRPTPKRRDQEAARRHPVVDPDRKKASTRDKTASREEGRRRQQAMLGGEEWALFERDRGVYRRYLRDYVDARWNVGEFLMPVILIGLVLSWIMTATSNDALFVPVFALIYGIFAAAIIDAFLAFRRMKKKFVAAHPNERADGGGMYAGMRMMQLRRTRTPRPQVARGQFPR